MVDIFNLRIVTSIIIIYDVHPVGPLQLTDHIISSFFFFSLFLLLRNLVCLFLLFSPIRLRLIFPSVSCLGSPQDPGFMTGGNDHPSD